jgi:hypothetical protein
MQNLNADIIQIFCKHENNKSRFNALSKEEKINEIINKIMELLKTGAFMVEGELNGLTGEFVPMHIEFYVAKYNSNIICVGQKQECQFADDEIVLPLVCFDFDIDFKEVSDAVMNYFSKIKNNKISKPYIFYHGNNVIKVEIFKS